MAIPEPVRRLALCPFLELKVPSSVRTFELEGARMFVDMYPTAQFVFPLSSELDVAATVEQTREIARSNAKETIGWWIPPEFDAIADELVANGLANEDTPGYEAIENAMALVEPPAGDHANEVEVRIAETFADYLAAMAVLIECFGLPELSEDEYRARYDEYVSDGIGKGFIAIADGRVIAHAFAAFASSGLNLFGGAVVPDFRGRGVYRALLQARWELAVERGTPALTVQAGRMSMPICERLGFEFVGACRVFVDSL